MTTKLIYHTKDTAINNISPFHEAISAMKDEIWIVCPYIGINYIQSILYDRKWRIISDINEWIFSNDGIYQKQIIDFIKKNKRKIRHYKNVHAKVIVSEQSLLLGSANFTNKGITGRVEMSAIIDDEQQVEEVREWFLDLWQRSEKINSSIFF